MHMLDYVLILYLKECNVKTVFHHSANDCEMRHVPFPNVGKRFGAGVINFTVIYTMVKIIHTGEKPIFVFNVCTVTHKTHNIEKVWINVDSTLFQVVCPLGQCLGFAYLFTVT